MRMIGILLLLIIALSINAELLITDKNYFLAQSLKVSISSLIEVDSDDHIVVEFIDEATPDNTYTPTGKMVRLVTVDGEEYWVRTWRPTGEF